MHTLLAIVIGASLWAWAVAHQVFIYYAFSILIERLPPPDKDSGKLYAYVYSVLQLVAANTKRSQDAVVVVKKPS